MLKDWLANNYFIYFSIINTKLFLASYDNAIALISDRNYLSNSCFLFLEVNDLLTKTNYKIVIWFANMHYANKRIRDPEHFFLFGDFWFRFSKEIWI